MKGPEWSPNALDTPRASMPGGWPPSRAVLPPSAAGVGELARGGGLPPCPPSCSRTGQLRQEEVGKAAYSRRKRRCGEVSPGVAALREAELAPSRYSETMKPHGVRGRRVDAHPVHPLAAAGVWG